MKLASERIFVTLLVSLSLAPSTVSAFGSLSEFLNAAGNVIRTSTALSTDIIAEPRWASSATNVVVRLCTGGTAFANAPIRFQADGAKATELLADIQNSVDTWNSVSGGMAFGTAVVDSGCGPNLGSNDSVGSPNGANRISFTNNMTAGVLALTHLHMTASGGVLTINESDIQFNSDYYEEGMGEPEVTEVWTTRRCHAAILGVPNNPSDSVETASATNCAVSGDDLRIGFRGVLTHELGHFIGLSHSMINDDYSPNDGSAVSTVATMFPAISNLAQSVTIESLNTDDTLSKLNLYGLTSTSSGGSISGTVYTTTNRTPLRAAHIYAFDVTNKVSLGGVYSGMGGTLASSTGTFTISGLPFDRPFILVAEPVNRTDVHPNLSYLAYNTPTEVAIESGTTGLLNFAVEAYPDKEIIDIRKYRNSDSAPGIGSATQITLTASSPTASGYDFYLSSNISAPNDAEGTSIAFNEDTSINNSNPLVITITAPGSLDQFDDATLTLSANNGDEDLDWSDGIDAPTWTGSSVQIAVDPSEFDPDNGDYTLSFVISDPRLGTFAKSEDISVSKWTKKADLGGGDDDGGGGGGCLIQSIRVVDKPFVQILGFLLALVFARLYFRKSFTS